MTNGHCSKTTNRKESGAGETQPPTNMNFMTINQAAKFLKLHPNTIRNFIVRGQLPAYRIGRTIRIDEHDLIEIAKKVEAKA